MEHFGPAESKTTTSHIKESINQLLQHENIDIINHQKVEYFLDKFSIKNTVNVFDWDGTVTFPNFNSIAVLRPADESNGRPLGIIAPYMLLVQKATSYDQLTSLLADKGVNLPVYAKERIASGMDYREFHRNMMNHWRQFTMEKSVERGINVNDFDVTHMHLRAGREELNHLLIHKHQSHSLVISAGLEDGILKKLTELNIDLDNDYQHLKSNKFLLDSDGVVIGYDPELITMFTKKHIDYHRYGISDKQRAIQWGDSASDTEMIDEHFPAENILNIGFANDDKHKRQEFHNSFDIVCTSTESSFHPFIDLLGL